MSCSTSNPSTQAVATNAGNRTRFATPSTNVREDKDGFVLETELPGVAKDGLELTVENGELVIVGRRTPAQPAGQALYRESRRLDYRRAFELDQSIDSSRITASLDQGVLTLRLPKTEAVKPRKITVG
jgi:HSP20 family protein